MKIEHWRCQERHRELQLDYGNLLGACLGGEGRAPTEQHCDTKKGSRDLKWNPANTAHVIETRLRYLADGTVDSTDDEFKAQLNDVLGLNIGYLKNSRKAILDSFSEWWRSVRSLPNSRQKAQQQLDRLENAAQHQPFSPVIVWFLRQKAMRGSGMNHARHSEGAFETVIETTMLANGTVPEPAAGSIADRAIFPDTMLDFHPRHTAEGMEGSGGAPWGKDRRPSSCRSDQVDGPRGLSGHLTSRLQVLRQDSSGCILQGCARAEP
jgi:hypothetical protein